MITKAISEEHFIRVIYDYLLYIHKDKEGEFSMSEKEDVARQALDLHKDYWERCKRDYDEVYYGPIHRDE